MEIERKWLVAGWPQGLKQTQQFSMRQGYISVRPTVRIREEALAGGKTEYILCFKSEGGLSREEIERPIDKTFFTELEQKILSGPLIPKLRRGYALENGLTLEVSHVDAEAPTAFWYAEIEFESEEQALAFKPEQAGLSAYLAKEVTGLPGQSMGAYWENTRANRK